MSRLLKALKVYTYNSSDHLALVSLRDHEPFRAFWPMRFIQIFGTKRWSVSVCVFRTETPITLDSPESKKWVRQ